MFPNHAPVTTVLVLDVGWPQSAFVLAALHRARFHVIRAISGAVDTVGLGGYCRQISAPDGFSPEYLQALIAQERPDLVLSLCEEYLPALWSLPAEQQALVYPQTTPHQRSALLNRRAMYDLARAVSVPVPRQVDVPNEAALAEAARAFGFPFVLRGTQGIGGKQVLVVRSETDARAGLRELLAVSPDAPFAQEFIDGPRFLVGVLASRGAIVRSYAQTTVEGIRPPTGPSIRVRSVDEPALMDHATRLFAEFGWDGLACAEFVRAPDGTFYFMEINPRPWAAIRAAHACGVPLIDQFTQQLRGATITGGASAVIGREVELFPQYVTAKLLGPNRLRARDLPALARCLMRAPWHQPRLMLHFARMAWWQRR